MLRKKSTKSSNKAIQVVLKILLNIILNYYIIVASVTIIIDTSYLLLHS